MTQSDRNKPSAAVYRPRGVLRLALLMITLLLLPAVWANQTIHERVLKKRVGWDWWNGAQFGAWIAASGGLGYAATDMRSRDDWWAYPAAAGSALCFGVAVAGGAKVKVSRDADSGAANHTSFRYVAPAIDTLPRVDIIGFGIAKRDQADWRLLEAADSYVNVVNFDGEYTNIMSLLGAQLGNVTKRNSNDNYPVFGKGNGEYLTVSLRGGNSAREYYYDHSQADWQEYMNGVTYWKVNPNHDQRFERLCIVPQDSQGNAVAALTVTVNGSNDGFTQACYQNALDDNHTFKVSK